MKLKILIIGLAAIAAASIYAASQKSVPLLPGTDLKCYVGTGDSATTFAYTDAYNTNRTFVDALGTTVTPKSTNSVTGGIVASFDFPAALWVRSDGATPDLAITATVTANAALTNTVQLFFTRSVNGGTDYDLNGEGTFSFTITPSGTAATVQSTNLPSAFLSGASNIKLWKVVTGANPTDAGILTVNRVHLGGFVP